MRKDLLLNRIDRVCNIVELSGVILVLALAFVFQMLLHELPCPLCLLQRLGFFGIALGFLLNLRFGFKPSHYAIVILSAIFTSFVALRQILLHIVPGTGAYGDAIFGLHFYTWSYIVSMIIIVFTVLIMSVDRQYKKIRERNRLFFWTTHTLFSITALLILLNVVAVLFECGLQWCPENPTHYLW